MCSHCKSGESWGDLFVFCKPDETLIAVFVFSGESLIGIFVFCKSAEKLVGWLVRIS